VCTASPAGAGTSPTSGSSLWLCKKYQSAISQDLLVAWSNERRNAPQLQAVLKIAKGETAKL
jgi:hypothetical protein